MAHLTENQPILGNLQEARQAYATRDSTLSHHVHDMKALAPETHISSGSYIKSIVFGGMDGIMTTFALVSGAAGGQLGSTVILIMGISNLLADGLSMGLGDYISSKAEEDYSLAEFERENWEFENYPEGEIEEMVQVYNNKGYTAEESKAIVQLLSRNKEAFVKIMMVEELGLMPPDEDDSPAKHGLIVPFVLPALSCTFHYFHHSSSMTEFCDNFPSQ
eukprot:TRINITY_DN12624_c0_g1_i12.p1 TRINITY_DN12624_c0_g1~~TRINITY_DN12624_c0_g1_i12.p1  ORF type:complete len:219 (-),score=44.36 TRINITY_DN12624_c0_g1_i12:393-1049(-)